MTRYIGPEIGGISYISEKNYAIIQSTSKLSIIEIRNMTNPVIVNELTSDTIGFSYQIASGGGFALLPSFQNFSLYSGKTFFYTKISSNNILGEKSFNIQLLGVDPITLDKSLETYSILNIKLDHTDQSLPYWITKDISGQSLTVKPQSLDNILLLRSFWLTFSTQISVAELNLVSHNKSASDVFNALLSLNFIDSNFIPTASYNPDITTLPLDTSFNISNIKILLDSHYYTKIVNFNINDFLDLDMAPQISVNSIQTQMNQLSSISIDKSLSFELDDFTFIDPEGDPIKYSAENVPSWLTFFSDSKRFLGTPTKNDIGSYFITITASDGYKNSSDYLQITVQKQKPLSISIPNAQLILGNTLFINIPLSTFIDLDGNSLSYNASIILANGSIADLPPWLNFDANQLRFYGSPQKSDISYDYDLLQYYQVFVIQVTAIDIADQIAQSIFNLTVINQSPIVNPIKTLVAQFNQSYNSYIKINEYINFEFSSDTFIDKEGDSLTYIVKNLPLWLNFNYRTIYGSPTKDDLRTYDIEIVASDGFSTVSDFLQIKVENFPPIASYIDNQSLILGNSFSFKLNDGVFIDPENELLTYNASLILNDSIIMPLPLWLVFDPINRLFTGNPTSKDINYNSTTSEYFQEFQILVTAKDIADATSFTNFTLDVKNSPPKVNLNKTLQSQFGGLHPQINSLTEFQIDSSTFVDDNNIKLSFDARLALGNYKGRRLSSNSSSTFTDATSLLPDWIKFDPILNKFTILPPESVVNKNFKIVVIVNNGLQSQSDSFSFTVDVSLDYVFTYILKILTPIIGAIGLIAYRVTLYNVLFKRYFIYSQYEKINIHENYMKKVYLIQEDLELAERMWLEIKHKNPDKNKKWAEYIYNEEFLIENLSMCKPKISTYIDPGDLEKDGILYGIVHGFMTYEAMKEFPRTNKIFKNIKKRLQAKYGHCWYLVLATINYEDCKEKRMLPIIQIKRSVLEEMIKKTRSLMEKGKCCHIFKKNIKSNRVFDEKTIELENSLLESLIKTHIFGIPPNALRWYEFLTSTNGESLLAIEEKVSEIQIIKEREFDGVITKLILRFLPLKKNDYNIYYWLNYTIKNKSFNILWNSIKKRCWKICYTCV